MPVVNELIEAGLALKRAGKTHAAIEHFRQLTATFPNEARVFFEYASALDASGNEDEAIPLYRDALQMGLSEQDLPRLYIQLGNALRAVGQADEAFDILTTGYKRFPKHRALRIFRVLALHSADRNQEAIVDVLDLMLDSLMPAKFDGYADNIRDSVDQLRSKQQPSVGHSESRIDIDVDTDDEFQEDE